MDTESDSDRIRPYSDKDKWVETAETAKAANTADCAGSNVVVSKASPVKETNLFTKTLNVVYDYFTRESQWNKLTN